jgi:hypothetical protein
MIRSLAVLGLLTLCACATVPVEEPPTRAQIADSTLPPMKAFTRPRPAPPTRSNREIADDFLSLHFNLESGRDLPALTRFEAPITVKVTGTPSPTLIPDLDRLLARLRREAGIDIRRIGSGEANVTIEAVSRADIRRALPEAACFVVPNVRSLAEYRRLRRSPQINWSLLERRETIGIFVPADTPPQEVRDCLHEELAQALGPLNDLYRLPDSVFNDDNVHTVLTGFDMLILRATYAPELHSGLSREAVAARLPALLSRLNPEGDRVRVRPTQPTPEAWRDAVQTALGPGASTATRRKAAEKANRIAIAEGWQDHRRAFSHYMLGRIAQVDDPVRAQQEFETALAILQGAPATELHRAYVTTQTAAYSLSRGDARGALRQIEPQIAVARRNENAALLATLLLLKADALEMSGRTAEARGVRLDSLGWARYGFGSELAVRAETREVAGLHGSDG